MPVSMSVPTLAAVVTVTAAAHPHTAAGHAAHVLTAHRWQWGFGLRVMFVRVMLGM